MNITFAKIYNTDYIHIFKDRSNGLYLSVNDAEQLWQELMQKCQEYWINEKRESDSAGHA